MQELEIPATFTIGSEENLADAVGRNAQEAPSAVVFKRRGPSSTWTDVTAAEFAAEVEETARGLVALGVKTGDRVGLMSKTRYEWTVCDYAIWSAGAVTVPIYETSSAEQVQWILSDSKSVAVIAETDTHIATIKEVRASLTDLVDVIHIDGGGLTELKTSGAKVTSSQVAAQRKDVGADSLATIIYTSGTTGRPKGCELTHGNLLMEARAVAEAEMAEIFSADGSTLLFLPLAHVFARVIEIGCVANRVTMGHSSDIKNLLADFATFRPHFILSVPRVFEKVYNTAKQRAHADGKGAIFDRAEKVAIAWSEGQDKGGAGVATNVQHAVFDRLVYSKLKAAMGGRVKYAVSGGAPLGTRLGHFFRGIGVTILEGYGLTESSAAATVNLPGRMKIGTVGRPVHGTAVRIAGDGEILLQGGNIFLGYWNNPAATEEVKDADGWFHTGDIGELDSDGFLKITGRKKELIVTAGGKNVAPNVLEDRLRAHPLVSQCMVVGDNQPFIGCLVTIDPEAFGPWKKANGKPDDATIESLREDPDLRKDIQGAVDEANKAVSKAEAIRSFRILGVDFTEEGGQLTPSLKLKRAVVMKEFGNEVEAIYSGSSKD